LGSTWKGSALLPVIPSVIAGPGMERIRSSGFPFVADKVLEKEFSTGALEICNWFREASGGNTCIP